MPQQNGVNLEKKTILDAFGLFWQLMGTPILNRKYFVLGVSNCDPM